MYSDIVGVVITGSLTCLALALEAIIVLIAFAAPFPFGIIACLVAVAGLGACFCAGALFVSTLKGALDG